MIEWIYYVVGLIFLVLFILSIMTKPILFREKWQAGLGYGVYAVLYLGLFFLMFFGEYNVTANNVNTAKAKTSNVAVDGPVIALEPRSIEKDTSTPDTNTTSTANSGNQYVDSNGKGLIKGNTSKTTGEKIYHVPNSTYYDSTKIEDTERWFKTVQEAEAAGYRAPKR